LICDIPVVCAPPRRERLVISDGNVVYSVIGFESMGEERAVYRVLVGETGGKETTGET
jgi:hypothetical protein